MRRKVGRSRCYLFWVTPLDIHPAGPNRRRFLAASAGGALAACSSSQPEPEVSQASEEPALDGGFIDGHVHVWTPDTDAYPISPKYEKADMKPPSFTPEELFAHCRPLGVERINLIQMSFYQDDHRYMLDMMASHPGIFSGTGLLTDITADGARPADRMRELGDKGLKAFRIGGRSSADGPGWMEHPNYKELYKVASERGLILSFLVNPADLAEVDRLCAEFPDAPVIIDHLARLRVASPTLAEDTEKLLRLADRPKVWVKVGAFYALSADGPPYVDLLPLIQRVVSTFGAERCMWESDCPFQVQPPNTYAASVELIRDRADFLSNDQKRQLLSKTAESLLFA
ncbi:MAG: amidohydrolase family protein [Bryobacterales bacterium]